MAKPWKPSRREGRVLLALLADLPLPYGLTLIRVSRVGSRTTYRLLARLESCGWVTAEMETLADERREQPRKVYTLTPEGRKTVFLLLRIGH